MGAVRFFRTLLISCLLSTLIPVLVDPASASFSNVAKAESCSTEKVELVSIIDSQMAAFKRRDFPKAYALTSKLFKRSFSLQSFAALITNAYPVLISNTNVLPGICKRLGNQAQIMVQVSDMKNNKTILIYKLSLNSNKWEIDGAVRVESSNLSGF